MRLTGEKIAKFQKKIFSWWKENRRDLPWRHTHNPYKIMVSEVMLQQTGVSRVLPKYAEFIEAWPTVQKLAQASAGDVLRLWKGMGYNRRALYLHKAAKTIVEEYHGKFSKSEKELSKLPGLGIYTARAILVFAYKQNIACVDTNIRQIITHFFFNDKPQKSSTIQSVADQLVPKQKSWQWHQALMDFGAARLHEVKKRRPERTCPEYNRRSRRITIPFNQSNRFFRGRIMDLLRKTSYIDNELFTKLQTSFGKSKTFYKKLLIDLEKEGLILHVKKKYSLPY